jgi:hypothetical protein
VHGSKLKSISQGMGLRTIRNGLKQTPHIQLSMRGDLNHVLLLRVRDCRGSKMVMEVSDSIRTIIWVFSFR